MIPTIERQRLAELDQQVRLDLRRHDFKERERLVICIVLDFSFAVGSERAVIQKLDDIVELTGISRGNVHTCIKALELMGVLSVEGSAYRVLPRSAQRVWQVRPSVNIARAEALSRQLRDLNNVTQGELIREEPTLAQALGAVSVEAALSVSHVPILGTSVPESGTKVSKLGTPLEEDLEDQSPKTSKTSKASKRYEIDMTKLPKFGDDELSSVPDLKTWADVTGWLIALEAKHGGWMGTGLGPTWSASFGRQWYARFKENPTRWRAVWNETLAMARERRVKDSIGGCANDLWCFERVG